MNKFNTFHVFFDLMDKESKFEVCTKMSDSDIERELNSQTYFSKYTACLSVKRINDDMFQSTYILPFKLFTHGNNLATFSKEHKETISNLISNKMTKTVFTLIDNVKNTISILDVKDNLEATDLIVALNNHHPNRSNQNTKIAVVFTKTAKYTFGETTTYINKKENRDYIITSITVNL